MSSLKFRLDIWRCFLSWIFVLIQSILYFLFDCKKYSILFFFQFSMTFVVVFVGGLHFIKGFKIGGTYTYVFCLIVCCYFIPFFSVVDLFLFKFNKKIGISVEFQFELQYLTTIVIGLYNFIWIVGSLFDHGFRLDLLKGITQTQYLVMGIEKDELLRIQENEYLPCDGIVRQEEGKVIEFSKSGDPVGTERTVTLGEQVKALSIVKGNTIVVQASRDGEQCARHFIHQLLFPSYMKESHVQESVTQLQNQSMAVFLVLMFLYCSILYLTSFILPLFLQSQGFEGEFVKIFSSNFATFSEFLEFALRSVISASVLFFPYSWIDLGFHSLVGNGVNHGILLKGYQYFQHQIEKAKLVVDFDAVFLYDTNTENLRAPFFVLELEWEEKMQKNNDPDFVDVLTLLKNEGYTKNLLRSILRKCRIFGEKKRFSYRLAGLLEEYFQREDDDEDMMEESLESTEFDIIQISKNGVEVRCKDETILDDLSVDCSTKKKENEYLSFLIGDESFVFEKNKIDRRNLLQEMEGEEEDVLEIESGEKKKIFVVVNRKYLLCTLELFPRIRRLESFLQFLMFLKSEEGGYERVFKVKYFSNLYTVEEMLRIIEFNMDQYFEHEKNRKFMDVICPGRLDDGERKQRLEILKGWIRDEDWIRSSGTKSLQTIEGFKDFVRQELLQSNENDSESDSSDSDDDDQEEEDVLLSRFNRRNKMAFLTYGDYIDYYHTISLPLFEIGKLFRVSYAHNTGKHTLFTEKLCAAILIRNRPHDIFLCSDVVRMVFYQSISSVFHGLYYNVFAVFGLLMFSLLIRRKEFPILFGALICFVVTLYFILRVTSIYNYERKTLEDLTRSSFGKKKEEEVKKEK